MSINIRGNNDYSILFSSLSTRQNPSNSFFGSTGKMSDLTNAVLGNGGSTGGVNLGDYASIKNGSYRKLLKSYFNMKAEEEKLAEDKTKKDDEAKVEKTDKADKGAGSVFASSWDDIVTEANAKTDALYTELGLKKGTVETGSYLDTII